MPNLRKAFLMRVNAGREKEYAARHQPIWEELAAVLKSHGVHNYSIFAGPGGLLVAYVEIEDEARWRCIAATEVCARWWHFMSDIMPAKADGSPVAQDLQEVFHLD